MVDVAIVGAGITGLAVADQLAAAGRSVVVLEARDRVGGRLWSVSDGVGTFDLGATWFWPGERRVQALIARLGLAIHAQHLQGDALYHEPPGAQRLDGNPVDVPSGRFSGGAQGLAEAVAKQLPVGTIRTGRAVQAITGDPSNDHLTVVLSGGGEVAARQVVVAVPPALAIDRIHFDPALPDRLAGLAAATPVWMGAVTKVVAVYDRPFWRERGLAGAAISHHGPLRELHDMSGPHGAPAAIFGFAPATTTGQPTPTVDAVVAQLVELFGPEAATPRAVHLRDWRDEAWTSPAGVERLTAYQTYGHPLYAEPAVGGRLRFASTETATEHPGHIEGALAAAERAATQILAASAASTRSPTGSTPS